MRLFLVDVNLRKEIVFVNDKSHKIWKISMVNYKANNPNCLKIIICFENQNNSKSSNSSSKSDFN